MTDTREFYAATVDEAVLKAAAALSVAPDQLSYEVIDAGGAGFLGIGARDARITVRNVESASQVNNSLLDPDVEAEDEVGEDAELSPDVGNESFTGESQGETVEAAIPEPKHEAGDVPAEVLEDTEKLITSFVQAMGLTARIDVYESEDEVAVDVASEETGLFIGQKGETIDALQQLLNIAVYKNRPFSKRIVLDAEGYRQRRIEAVQGIAHRTARKVVREGNPIGLPPMNSSERRIVHVYLKDDPKVSTDSEGTGSNRRVVVSPA